MKPTLVCIMLAAFWPFAASQTIDSWLFNDSPRNIYLASPASGHWATLTRYGNSPANHGYDPQSTVLFSSWQPVVREVAPHRWQVTFILPNQL